MMHLVYNGGSQTPSTTSLFRLKVWLGLDQHQINSKPGLKMVTQTQTGLKYVSTECKQCLTLNQKSIYLKASIKVNEIISNWNKS